LLKCTFENTDLSETYFDKCVLSNIRFGGKCSMTRGDFYNCDLIESDLTCAEIHEIAIRGNQTNLTKLRLTVKQRREIEFSYEVDISKMIVVLLPTRMIARRYMLGPRGNFWIFDTCHGITETISLVLDCVGIGTVLGLGYAMFCGALENRSPLLPILLKTYAIVTVPLIGISIWSYACLSRLRKQSLPASQSEATSRHV
jgi:uncharacterized protein YjbI with pentapeptide repeats